MRVSVTGSIIFFVVSIMAILAEGTLSYFDGTFTLAQIRKRGHTKGMPFVFHAAMWTDLLIINPIMAISLYRYGGLWSLKQILIVGAIALAANVVMHLLYVSNNYPDPLAWGGRLTSAGYIHVLYAGAGYTIMGLLYFCTPGIDHAFLFNVSALLCLHIFVGTHMIINMIEPSWWMKTISTDKGSIVTILVVWALIGLRCFQIVH